MLSNSLDCKMTELKSFRSHDVHWRRLSASRSSSASQAEWLIEIETEKSMLSLVVYYDCK